MEWIAVMITIVGASGTASLPIVDTIKSDISFETKADCEAALIHFAALDNRLILRENLEGNVVATSNLEEPIAEGVHLACAQVRTH